MKRLKKVAALVMALVVCSVSGTVSPLTSSADDFDDAFSELFGDLYDETFWDKFRPGDCNLDGKFSLSDIVMLQKYLLGSGELTFWVNADYTFDQQIDVFDLCLMKRALVQQTTDASAVYASPDEEYKTIFNITTYHNNRSDVTVTWIDPDGDKEKTDTFVVDNGNPFTSDGQWNDDVTYTDAENYWIKWGDTSVIINWQDAENGMQEVVLEYPDRTKNRQTLSKNIVNAAAPEITAVDLSADIYGAIEDKVSIYVSKIDYLYRTAGRIGSVIQMDTVDAIENYSMTLHYDEDALGVIPEQNLIVIAPTKMSKAIKVPDMVLDTENNTITFSGSKYDYILDKYFIVVDAYQWYLSEGEDASEYAYTIPDTAQ